MVKFITILRDLLAKKCELSPGTTLGSILEMFRDQLGHLKSTATRRTHHFNHPQ
jgi:hypothetical protein